MRPQSSDLKHELPLHTRSLLCAADALVSVRAVDGHWQVCASAPAQRLHELAGMQELPVDAVCVRTGALQHQYVCSCRSHAHTLAVWLFERLSAQAHAWHCMEQLQTALPTSAPAPSKPAARRL